MCAYIELSLGDHNSSVANKQMLIEKEKCRLKPEDIYVSESDVRAPLQLMLDLTVRRLLLNPDIVKTIFDLQNKFKNVKLEFIYKLGKKSIFFNNTYK